MKEWRVRSSRTSRASTLLAFRAREVFVCMCVKCVCLNFCIFVFWVVEIFGFGGDFGVLAFLELGKSFNVCGCFLN
jgi:hypothetical protein